MGVGISKVPNLLKSLDSESILKQVQHRIQNDKTGATFIVTQPDSRRGRILVIEFTKRRFSLERKQCRLQM